MKIADSPLSCRKQPPFKAHLLRQMIAGCATTGIVAVAPTAQAVGLGEAVSHSSIGSVFSAEIPLFLRAGEQVEEGCIQFAPRPQDDMIDLPWISSGRIALRQTSKGAVVVVTARPVQHPAVMFGIIVSCDTSLRRDYTVLLDPPNTAGTPLLTEATETRSLDPRGETARARQPEHTQTPPQYWISNPGDTLNSIARRLYPHKTAIQRRYVALQLGSGKLPASSTAYGELDAGTQLEILPASALRPSAPPATAQATPLPAPAASLGSPHPKPASPRNRVVISAGSESSLQLAKAMEQRPEMSETDRSRLKKELQLIAALDDKNAEHIELLERIKQLEALQTRLEADAVKLQAQIAQAQSAAAGMTATAPGQQTPIGFTQHTPEHLSASPPLATEEAPTTKTRVWYQKPYALVGLLGVLAGIVAFGMLWIQRCKRDSEEDFKEEFLSTLAEPQVELPAPVPVEGDPLMEPLSEADIWPDAVDASAAVNTRSMDGTIAHLSTNAPSTLMQADGEDEHNSAIELAEIMMSFGRVQGAAQTLADFIRANPKQAVKPWMKLLEVYRIANMQMEFEALTAQLNKTFNVQPVSWDKFDITRNAQDSLEGHEHIRLQLCTLWGTQACQAYLHHLLRDNRQGTRQGFPLAIIDEILLLLGILEQRLGPYRPNMAETTAPPSQKQIPATVLLPPETKPAVQQAQPLAAAIGSAIQPPPPQELAGNLDFDLIDMELLSKTLHINLDDLSQLPTTSQSAQHF
ncbi:type IV pilus assembly protein FimV [Uliginosibacterium gangwonense]|uniref:type IV pilus assembly protein FimV n=1 Tax=Uliginosibacterium gangwonense TaxID=392736 RepID=UPI0012FB290E|nr:hypothetical protein [Uliginosibacterium gangwonense]